MGIGDKLFDAVPAFAIGRKKFGAIGSQLMTPDKSEQFGTADNYYRGLGNMFSGDDRFGK